MKSSAPVTDQRKIDDYLAFYSNEQLLRMAYTMLTTVAEKEASLAKPRYPWLLDNVTMTVIHAALLKCDPVGKGEG